MHGTRTRRPSHRSGSLRALRLATLFLGLAAPAAAQDASLTGTWRHVDSDAEREVRHRAIDRATDDMNIFTQGPARGRLRDATRPAPELTLTDAGARVTLRSNGRTVSVPTDGTPTRVSSDRGVGTFVATRRDGRLVLTTRGDGGRRTTVYRLSADGRRLVLEVRLEGDRLSAPVRYRVTYRRS